MLVHEGDVSEEVHSAYPLLVVLPEVSVEQEELEPPPSLSHHQSSHQNLCQCSSSFLALLFTRLYLCQMKDYYHHLYIVEWP
jgi:hypothetical protein